MTSKIFTYELVIRGRPKSEEADKFMNRFNEIFSGLTGKKQRVYLNVEVARATFTITSKSGTEPTKEQIDGVVAITKEHFEKVFSDVHVKHHLISTVDGENVSIKGVKK